MELKEVTEERRKAPREYIVSGWHLEKKITVGELMTILGLFVAAFWWFSNIETRINYVNSEIRRVEEKADLQNKSILGLLNRIDRKLNKMDDKLDRKVDKE